MVINTTLVTHNNMERYNQKSIGINGILRVFNLFVACLIASRFFGEERIDHPYLDWLTLVLGLGLCLQTHIVLRLEQRNPDPFVLIMAYLLTFFYSLRIFTLSIYPVAGVFLKYDYGPSDSNHALLYILIANTFMYAGFYRVKLKGAVEINATGYLPAIPRTVVVMLVLSILFGLFVQQVIPESISSFINIIYNNFLSSDIILLVLAAYVIVYRKNLPSIYLKIVLCFSVVLLVMQTLESSRSGLLAFANNLLILVLALLPTLRLLRKYVVVGFLLLPLLLATSFTLYAISTTSRLVKDDNVTSITEKMKLMQTSYEKLNDDARVDYFIGEAFSRAGYFDFAAELIANRERYSGIFTLENYLKSIVDNVLTPGFDLFDMPKISNSLKYAYGDFGTYSKKQEIVGSYHTDIFLIYGEMYNLFGYASLVILYLASFFIKKAYRYNGKLSPHLIALNRILWLTIFFRMMNSFGFDWILMDITILLVSFYGLSKLFRQRLDNTRSLQTSRGSNRGHIGVMK